MKRPSTGVFRLVLLLSLVLSSSALLRSQSADTVLLNGKILTVDSQFSVRQALAIREGKIAAVGTNAQIKKLQGPKSQVIDLQDRTVIPGLIDNHMHAVRAALTWKTEVNWIGASSLAEALSRLHEAAEKAKPGTWLAVVTPPSTLETFKEKRRPTQGELVAAAPNNPVYVQLSYGSAIMTPLAFQTLNIKSDSDLPARTKLEKDANGNLTGTVNGNMIALYDRLPRPTFDEEVEGTKDFFRELNRLGLTGVVDPGGNNLRPEDYQAVFKVWRDGQMTIRMAYSASALAPDTEFQDFKNYLTLLPMGLGDNMLRFNGLGEKITWAMQGITGQATPEELQKYYEILRWAAQRGLTVTMHWDSDKNVEQLLATWERVNKEFPLANLRWTIAHINDASPATFERMKALGVGWTMQDEMWNSGDDVVKRRGADVASRMPPANTAKKIGIHISLGTDAHRVSTYNPFTVLQWALDGKTASGAPVRGPEEAPSREDALRYYTMGSAWVSFDEGRRGSLETGKLADLAVLSQDYMTEPVEQIGQNVSLLTMVGGKIVYATGPYAHLEQKLPRQSANERLSSANLP
jgi:predicted amidohydrolase YtcJ